MLRLGVAVTCSNRPGVFWLFPMGDQAQALSLLFGRNSMLCFGPGLTGKMDSHDFMFSKRFEDPTTWKTSNVSHFSRDIQWHVLVARFSTFQANLTDYVWLCPDYMSSRVGTCTSPKQSQPLTELWWTSSGVGFADADSLWASKAKLSCRSSTSAWIRKLFLAPTESQNIEVYQSWNTLHFPAIPIFPQRLFLLLANRWLNSIFLYVAFPSCLATHDQPQLLRFEVFEQYLLSVLVIRCVTSRLWWKRVPDFSKLSSVTQQLFHISAFWGGFVCKQKQIDRLMALAELQARQRCFLGMFKVWLFQDVNIEWFCLCPCILLLPMSAMTTLLAHDVSGMNGALPLSFV